MIKDVNIKSEFVKAGSDYWCEKYGQYVRDLDHYVIENLQQFERDWYDEHGIYPSVEETKSFMRMFVGMLRNIHYQNHESRYAHACSLLHGLVDEDSPINTFWFIAEIRSIK